MVVLDDFPNTKFEPFEQASDVDLKYNCIAWAANDYQRWYEPDPFGIYFWPKKIPREYSISSYVALFKLLGYEICENGDYEIGFEKVAVYSKDNIPTHAARQLDNGLWTSKLGKNIDVVHSLFSIMNGSYGNVAQYLKRPKINTTNNIF
jgi:hypothetical protein